MQFFIIFRRLWWKGTISVVMYLSMEQLGFHRTAFRKYFFFIFIQICRPDSSLVIMRQSIGHLT